MWHDWKVPLAMMQSSSTEFPYEKIIKSSNNMKETGQVMSSCLHMVRGKELSAYTTTLMKVSLSKNKWKGTEVWHMVNEQNGFIYS